MIMEIALIIFIILWPLIFVVLVNEAEEEGLECDAANIMCVTIAATVIAAFVFAVLLGLQLIGRWL